MSTPETPSTSAWWVFETIAKRLRVRPWTSQSSQSGFVRSSCWREDPGGEVAQLLLGSRRGQRRVADVVLEVEGRVVDPERPARLDRRVRELLAEARHQVKARPDVLAACPRKPAAALRRSSPRRRACGPTDDSLVEERDVECRRVGPCDLAPWLRTYPLADACSCELLLPCRGPRRSRAAVRSDSGRARARAVRRRTRVRDLEAQVDDRPAALGLAGERRAGGADRRAPPRGRAPRTSRVQRPLRNVVATIPGTGEGTVVVGAHHDTKDDFPASWAPTTALRASPSCSNSPASLAAEAPLDGPSIRLALFDAEEARGDRHSRRTAPAASQQYVELRRGRRQPGLAAA